MGNTLVRTGLILLILSLTVVIAVLVFNLAPLLGQRNHAVATPPPPRQGLVTSRTTLADAALLAEERARDWAEDATLVRAEGNWIASPGWQRVDVPPIVWAFSYYSPSRGELAAVTIRDGEILWVPPRAIPIIPQPLVDFPPASGADAVWLSFRAANGEAFLRDHPNTQVRFVLQSREGAPTWTVSARQDSGQVQVNMDARSGVVSVP